jgi:hypothetical protein
VPVCPGVDHHHHNRAVFERHLLHHQTVLACDSCEFCVKQIRSIRFLDFPVVCACLAFTVKLHG